MNVKEIGEIPISNNVFEVGMITVPNEFNKSKYIFRNIIKRCIDIIIGVVGVICLIPLTCIIYVCEKILREDGPLFYEQLRIGKNGKNFKLYKFRTMVVGADEILQEYLDENEEAREEYKKYKKLKNDPRVTKLGNFLRKTSLDETPQFINVLKGEMSLIGPRPYLPKEKEEMGTRYGEIIKCRPGITGLWQVNGRSQTSYLQRVNIEAFYAQNYSLKLDIQIFFKTIKSVVKREGAI